jgi:hypothetical protein
MWRVDSCHPRLCAPLHSQHIVIFVTFTCFRILCIHHIFTFDGVNVKILWWHAYNIRMRSKQAWCAASFGAIGAFMRLRFHEISLYSWRSHGSDTIHHIFTFQGVNLKILWWHAYDVRTWSKHAWCAASFGAIGSVIRLGVHEISLNSWGFARFRHYTSYIHIPRSKSQNSLVTRIRY